MNDCELYNHPNVTGEGCPCGRLVTLHPPKADPGPPPEWMWTQPPPILEVIRGEAPTQPKAQIRTHHSSLRRPEVWA